MIKVKLQTMHNRVRCYLQRKKAVMGKKKHNQLPLKISKSPDK